MDPLIYTRLFEQKNAILELEATFSKNSKNFSFRQQYSVINNKQIEKRSKTQNKVREKMSVYPRSRHTEVEIGSEQKKPPVTNTKHSKLKLNKELFPIYLSSSLYRIRKS